ncbi:hypothetical protein [Methylobacterium haplocladii]|uniref:hypothetical protein n=1 Tax=Methylobacterium haplocladii TaxID=1176176 RepID=UPI0024E0B539|nr:hypothetical protein [Methylobacterium haplocladii]
MQPEPGLTVGIRVERGTDCASQRTRRRIARWNVCQRASQAPRPRYSRGNATHQGHSYFMTGANMVFSKIITFGVTVAFAGMLVIAAVGSSGLLLDY